MSHFHSSLNCFSIGIEIGQGLQTKMLQITAEQLGIDLSLIRIHETATDKIPNATPTVASLASDLNGPALINACEQLKKNLAPLKEKYPTLTWEKLIEQAYNERIQLFATGFYIIPEKFLKNKWKNHLDFILFVKVKVEKIVVIHKNVVFIESNLYRKLASKRKRFKGSISLQA